MSKIKTIIQLLSHWQSNEFLLALLGNMTCLFTDQQYLKIRYRLAMGKKLDLKDPKTFNEKLQWLKLYDRKPEYSGLVDKFRVKDFVKRKIGEEFVIPTIGCWNASSEIDFIQLPNSFVLKTTNGGGGCGVVICKNKAVFDEDRAKKILDYSLKEQDIYKKSKEWPYKNVDRKIIAEPYIEDSETKELRDYKFFCFNGQVKAMFVATERQKEGEDVKFDFFDSDFNHLPIRQGHPNAVEIPKKPQHFEEMKIIASKLSEGIPQVRVDLYEANGRIYFGEMTFFHFAGMMPFEPESWDKIFGDWIELPEKTYEK